MTTKSKLKDLAHLVKERTGSASPIEYIPYDQAYEPGFEDMFRRVPCCGKAGVAHGLPATHTFGGDCGPGCIPCGGQTAADAPKLFEIPSRDTLGKCCPNMLDPDVNDA